MVCLPNLCKALGLILNYDQNIKKKAWTLNNNISK